MICVNCGALLDEDVRFCTLCGTRQPLPETADAAPVPPEETPAPQVTAQSTDSPQEAACEISEPVAELVAEPVAEPVVQPAPEPVIPSEVPPQPVYVMPPAAPATPAKKPYRPKPKPHIALRIPLQILSFLLSFILAFSLLGTVLLADLNHLMSAGGIKQLINAVLIPTSAPHHVRPTVGALGVQLDNVPIMPGFEISDDVQIDISDIPADIFSDGAVDMDGLIDWIYDAVEEAAGQPLPVGKEQVEEFIAESTVSDFVSEKLAGYAEDFINGTENTTITTEELLELLDENQKLLEEKFQVELTPEAKEALTSSLENTLAETDLNTVIREQVFETVEESIDQTMQEAGMSWEQLQPMLQVICSDAALYSAIGLCAVLMLLLCLLNFYNIPGGLTWIAVPSILMGTLATLPLLLLTASPELLSGILPGGVGDILASFAGVLLPIHAAVPLLGLGLLIISIIWRAIRGAVRRSRLRASVA